MHTGDDDGMAGAQRLEEIESAPALIALIRAQLDGGLHRLRFVPRLEREFLRQNNVSAHNNRIALLVIAVGVLLLSPVFNTAYFGVSERAARLSNLVLLGVLLPILVATIAWLTLRAHSAANEWVITAQFAAVSGGLLTNHAILEQHGSDFPIEFVGVALVAVVALGRVRSWIILPVGIGLAVLTFVVEAIWLQPTPDDLYHLAAAGVLALFAAYLQCASDYVLRRAWLERRLLQLVARRDGLTGLLNRHALESALATAHAHAVRERCGYGLAMIDIDQFGAYNNHYGHPAGDEALRRVAETIEAHARRPLDVCGRYGGEEFVVLWMEDRAQSLERPADALRQAIADLSIPHARSAVADVVTVSVGLCHVSSPQRHDSLSGVLAAADERLYDAKRGGRNRVVVGRYDDHADAA